MKIKILTDRYSASKEINEIKQLWIDNILQLCEVDTSEFEQMDKGNIDDLLYSLSIDIIDYPNMDAIQIKKGDEIIAELGEPSYTLLKDEKGYYYEIEIENWSIFDEE